VGARAARRGGWTPPPAREPGRGVVEALLVAAAAEARMERRDRVEVEAGRGIVGDRYHAAAGTFGAGTPLTLVAAEVLQELGIGDEHRRSVVTRGVDLGALVGREFAVGELRCRGLRLCEPCAHLDRLAGGGLLRPLVHRGGLRADALSGGTIATGDRVQAL
jgi:MOSC domain-containing protein YiiM